MQGTGLKDERVDLVPEQKQTVAMWPSMGAEQAGGCQRGAVWSVMSVRAALPSFLGRVGQTSVGIRKKTGGGRQKDLGCRRKCKEFYSIQLCLFQEVTESLFEKQDTPTSRFWRGQMAVTSTGPIRPGDRLFWEDRERHGSPSGWLWHARQASLLWAARLFRKG